MKTKKILAMLLAIVILAGLLPFTALAAAKPTLVLRDIDSEEYHEEYSFFGTYTESFDPALLIGDELYPIDPAALYSSDISALSVAPSSEYEGAVCLKALADYGAEVRYNHSDGKTYSFKVKTVLPSVAVYSKPEANGANYLRSFTAREGDDTLYLILRDGWTIEGLSLEYFANDCSFVISPDKTTATITVGPDALPPAYPYLVIDVVDDMGHRQVAKHRFDLTTAFPDLYFRYSGWNNGPTEDLTTEPSRAWETAKGNQTVCHFYFFDGTAETLLPVDRLYSTNKDVVGISAYSEGSTAVQMDAVGFGTAEILYEHNGITHAMPVISALPEYGFYTAPVSSEAAYVEDTKGIQITEENRTVYLVLGDSIPNHTIAGIDPFADDYGPFPEGTFYTIAEDGRSAAITIGGGKKGTSYYSLHFELNISETDSTDVYSLRLIVERDTDMVAPIPTPTPTPTPVVNPFADVAKGQYYYEPVLWAVKKSVTSGTSATTFSPDSPCTRGQVVTFLWRAAGEPVPANAANPFSDVSESDFFYTAVLWAVEQGVTSGTSATAFSPDAPCTRAQVATFLWRAEGKPTAEVQSNGFTDVTDGQYYYDAVLWCVKKGVTTGVSAERFAPDDTCTRGQIVTFLYRALASK